jgi:hypothetical protein
MHVREQTEPSPEPRPREDGRAAAWRDPTEIGGYSLSAGSSPLALRGDGSSVSGERSL